MFKKVVSRVAGSQRRAFSAQFTVKSKGGDTTFTSNLSLQEAIRKVQALGSLDDFQSKLLDQYQERNSLSPKQEGYVHYWALGRPDGSGSKAGQNFQDRPSSGSGYQKKSGGGYQKQTSSGGGAKSYTVKSKGREETFESSLSVADAVRIVEVKNQRHNNDFMGTLVEEGKHWGDSLSAGKKAWLLKFAEQELRDHPETRSKRKIFIKKKSGESVEFETDLLLNEAYSIVKRSPKQNDFKGSLVASYEKSGDGMNPVMANWMLKLATEEKVDPALGTDYASSAGVRTITVSSKKGPITFTTSLSLAEAAAIIERTQKKPSEFINKLLASYHSGTLSEKMEHWLLKVAQDNDDTGSGGVPVKKDRGRAREQDHVGHYKPKEQEYEFVEGTADPEEMTLEKAKGGNPETFTNTFTESEAFSVLRQIPKPRTLVNSLLQKRKKGDGLKEAEMKWVYFIANEHQDKMKAEVEKRQKEMAEAAAEVDEEEDELNPYEKVEGTAKANKMELLVEGDTKRWTNVFTLDEACQVLLQNPDLEKDERTYSFVKEYSSSQTLDDKQIPFLLLAAHEYQDRMIRECEPAEEA